eukprot:CAMPEP_0172501496 /NCGR_PEP_ID=MMETSP1066-20121228/150412_1 /TAXON_ID=671091 /ORGANISM="Coscinodiscus wailesii, Strain CCMP2513" /LENGTH=310 /DNA_ID=CAMNT_0013276297 /DNA_START=178 /DNA_END=1107 /DNA_ORIENTATION=+
MTIISEIKDRGAVVAWSPLTDHADVIALGTKDSGGIGFDDYGGELEIYDTSITSTCEPRVLGKIKTTSRFASLAWTATTDNDDYPMGLVAGGMIDGSVTVWDPAVICRDDNSSATTALLSTIPPTAGGGSLTALQFNPHPSHATDLATGSTNGTLSLHSLTDPTSPTAAAGTSHTLHGEVTRVAWNTQVPHILAAATSGGTVTVFDTKQSKPWCEIRAESGAPVSAMAWNPTEGLHLLTASGDDRNPVLKLWDLRASTTVPLATLAGHEQAVLSVCWNPHDGSLLVSCGKDNKTILWDLYSGRPVYEIPQ